MELAAIGLVAGALTTGAWLPQLYRTWRRRSADDISWPYLLTFGTGIVIWIVYGSANGDVALLVANIVTLVLLVGVVALKLRTDGGGQSVTPSTSVTGEPRIDT